MAEESETSRLNNVEDLPADLSLTREKFMLEIVPEIFGAEAKVGATAEVTRNDVNDILRAYETHLASRGLLNTEAEPKREA